MQVEIGVTVSSQIRSETQWLLSSVRTRDIETSVGLVPGLIKPSLVAMDKEQELEFYMAPLKIFPGLTRTQVLVDLFISDTRLNEKEVEEMAQNIADVHAHMVHGSGAQDFRLTFIARLSQPAFVCVVDARLVPS